MFKRSYLKNKADGNDLYTKIFEESLILKLNLKYFYKVKSYEKFQEIV